jgi:hypothetical protein
VHRPAVLHREKEIRSSGGSTEPPGPLPDRLLEAHIEYSECRPSLVTPLAERELFAPGIASIRRRRTRSNLPIATSKRVRPPCSCARDLLCGLLARALLRAPTRSHRLLPPCTDSLAIAHTLSCVPFPVARRTGQKSLARLWWDEIFTTCIGRMHIHSHKNMHPGQFRSFSAREYARAQGFPDWYQVRFFPPPVAQRRPYSIALPIQPLYSSHTQ